MSKGTNGHMSPLDPYLKLLNAAANRRTYRKLCHIAEATHRYEAWGGSRAKPSMVTGKVTPAEQTHTHARAHTQMQTMLNPGGGSSTTAPSHGYSPLFPRIQPLFPLEWLPPPKDTGFSSHV